MTAWFRQAVSLVIGFSALSRALFRVDGDATAHETLRSRCSPCKQSIPNKSSDATPVPALQTINRRYGQDSCWITNDADITPACPKSSGLQQRSAERRTNDHAHYACASAETSPLRTENPSVAVDELPMPDTSVPHAACSNSLLWRPCHGGSISKLVRTSRDTLEAVFGLPWKSARSAASLMFSSNRSCSIAHRPSERSNCIVHSLTLNH